MLVIPRQFYPPAELRPLIPKLSQTDSRDKESADNLLDEIAYCHYYLGPKFWLVLAYDPKEKMALGFFGDVVEKTGDFGYFSLVDLAQLTQKVQYRSGFDEEFTQGLQVRRNRQWQPQTLRELGLDTYEVEISLASQPNINNYDFLVPS